MYKIYKDYTIVREKIYYDSIFLGDYKNKVYIIIRWTISSFVFDFYPNVYEFKNATKNILVPNYYFIISAKENILKSRVGKREKFSLCMELQEQIKRYEYSFQVFNNIELLYNNTKKDFNYIVSYISKLIDNN